MRTGKLLPVAFATCLTAASLCPAPLTAQSSSDAPRLLGRLVGIPAPADVTPVFRSAEDSVAFERARELAGGARESRLIIALFERRLIWAAGVDTLFVAQVAVGRGDSLTYERHEWDFATPRGKRRVIAKQENPIWIPPLWHYVKHAEKTGRQLVELQRGSRVALSDGSRLVVRGDLVGRLLPDGQFVPSPPGDHIIFDETVFVPPFGTANREIIGELGAYKLDLGDAYLIHGTPHTASIGTASTHGCIRVGDDDLVFLYRNIPLGTPVYIY